MHQFQFIDICICRKTLWVLCSSAAAALPTLSFPRQVSPEGNSNPILKYLCTTGEEKCFSQKYPSFQILVILLQKRLEIYLKNCVHCVKSLKLRALRIQSLSLQTLSWKSFLRKRDDTWQLAFKCISRNWNFSTPFLATLAFGGGNLAKLEPGLEAWLQNFWYGKSMQLQNEECTILQRIFQMSFSLCRTTATTPTTSSYDGTNAFRVQFFKFSPNNVDQYTHT